MNMHTVHDTSIGVYIWSCCECDKVWRAPGVEWCPQCGEAEGIRLRLTPWRGECVEQAIRILEDEFKDNGDAVDLASAMQVHSPWYDNDCPSHIQACWTYLRDQHSTAPIQRAMEIFETRFQTAIFNLNENRQRYAHNQEPIHMG